MNLKDMKIDSSYLNKGGKLFLAPYEDGVDGLLVGELHSKLRFRCKTFNVLPGLVMSN